VPLFDRDGPADVMAGIDAGEQAPRVRLGEPVERVVLAPRVVALDL
jgi:hypothetical protein